MSRMSKLQIRLHQATAPQLPTSEELRQNRRAGFQRLWWVWEDYTIEGEVLRPEGGFRRVYCPAIEPELLEEFAGVHDKKTLVTFARKFGLLGRGVRDRVKAVLSHASRVRAVYDLLGLLARREVPRQELPTILRSAGVRLFSPTESVPDLQEFIRTRGAFVPASWPKDPRRTAYGALAKLINPNIAGLHYRLASAKEESPGLYLNFSALIEVIYWRLAARSRREWRWCQRPQCGITFPVHDPRQKFCSPRCANLNKVHAFRERKRFRHSKKLRRTRR